MELPPASEFAFFRLVQSLDPRIFGSCLTGEFVSFKIIAFGYVTQRPTFVFASVVNAAHCKRINRITLMVVVPSGEYQSSLYLSLASALFVLQSVPGVPLIPFQFTFRWHVDVITSNHTELFSCWILCITHAFNIQVQYHNFFTFHDILFSSCREHPLIQTLIPHLFRGFPAAFPVASLDGWELFPHPPECSRCRRDPPPLFHWGCGSPWRKKIIIIN